MTEEAWLYKHEIGPPSLESAKATLITLSMSSGCAQTTLIGAIAVAPN
ncbi:MAG TPA: hypothetical protein VGQ95_12560 [Chthoniobacterales bacterium]|nr:hypothetical protein [Chthoniobacterales bacterium]